MKKYLSRVLLCFLCFVLLLPAAASAELITSGSSGEAVYRLQQRLLDLGYFNYKPTGSYGSMTRNAVIAFQQYNDLAADGAAGDVPVDFEVVDAQDIPYADESYDAVTMAYGIRNMPDRPRALAEMLRVLRPGGVLVCLEFSTPPNALWRALYGFYLKHLIPFWGGLITGDR